MDLLQADTVLQQIAIPSEQLSLEAEYLRNFVKGEYEDEDGDWATAFIQADPIPHSIMPTSRIVPMVLPEAKEEAHFFCSLCSQSTPLNMIYTELSCSCLFCNPCISSYTHSLLKLASQCATNEDETSINQIDLGFIDKYQREKAHLCASSDAFSTPLKEKKVANMIRANVETLKETLDTVRMEDPDSMLARANGNPCADSEPCKKRFSDNGLFGLPSTDAFPCPSPMCTGTFSLASAQQLSPQAFIQWQEVVDQALFESTSNYVKCPGCKIVIEKVGGELPFGLAVSGVPEIDKTVPFTELDCDGRPMSRAALLHKAINRFRCAICHADFCGSCLESPYHLGRTCEQFLAEKHSPKCKYCQGFIHPTEQQDLKLSTKSVNDLLYWLTKEGADISWCVERSELLAVQRLVSFVCGQEECRNKLKDACTRTLVCGHQCGGVRGELNCLPCLEDACCKREKALSGASFLPLGSDLCTICAVESLHCAPSIQLKCGHIVHLHCAKAKVAGGWPGPEISFNYLQCSQCSEPMKHTHLDASLQQPLSVKTLVEDKALKRLKTDHFSKSSTEILPGGRYEGRPAEYALHIYQYYLCCKCGDPYFGGTRDCIDEEEQRVEGGPPDLLCGSCSAGEQHFCRNGHGNEYLEFKCQFCCSLATYVCYGRVHFCDICHLIRPDLQQHFVPYQCKGPKDCPLRIAHPPNGQRYCLGCSLCRLQNQ